MKDETYEVIESAVRDLLMARKDYPDLYTDDRIIVMAISVASIEQPDAPVIAVYQAVRTELVRQLAAGVQ